MVFEKGVVAFEKGVLVFEKGVVAFHTCEKITSSLTGGLQTP